jgi:lysophospholipase L1-like esterase
MILKCVGACVLSGLLGGVAWGDLLVKAGDKVAFLGDSITEGGASVNGGYVRLTVSGLEALGAKVELIPAGVGGNTSRDMLARLDKDVLSKKPTWMTLSCGVNDVWHGPTGCTLEEYQKNMTAIVDQAQAAGIKVLIMTATVIGEDKNESNNKLATYNDWLRGFAAQRHLPVAEENGAFQAEVKKDQDAGLPGFLNITVDGVHPNQDGSVILAKTLLGAFGASPAQVDQAVAAWMALPDSAMLPFGIGCAKQVVISMAQYEKVKAMAVSRKVTVRQFLDDMMVRSYAEAVEAHKGEAIIDPHTIDVDTQRIVEGKARELLK